MESTPIALPNKEYEMKLKEIIKNNLTKSFEEHEIVYSPGSSKGDNYLGVLYRIQVFDKSTNEQKLSVIVKLPPENPIRRKELNINMYFNREADFYNNVYPMYKKFQEDKGIDVEKDGFHHVPFCYTAVSEDLKEGIFLEDLKASHFEMFDRLKDPTREHVLLAMRSLAKFHAIFYAIKDQKPKLIEKYYDLKDTFTLMCDRENSNMDIWFQNLKEQAKEVVYKSTNKEMIETVESFLKPSLTQLMKNCLDQEKMKEYAAICHGDCWNNNMLFKTDQNGTPYDLRFLDFQMMRFASPVTDLAYYIFCCTTKSLRDKHYQEFLDVYHKEFSSYVQRLGSNPENLFPRRALDQHLKEFGKFGFLMAIIVIPFFTSDSEDTPDMDELAEQFQKLGESSEEDKKALTKVKEKSYEKYAERMMGICHDMYSLGYFNK